MTRKLLKLSIILLFLCVSMNSLTTIAQTFDWAKSIGGSSDDVSYSVAVDGLGNVYVTGSFQNAVDFDPGSGVAILNSQGGRDVFLAKYDARGNYVWAKSIGGSGNDVGYGIAVDGSGNAYVTGAFRNTVDFNPGSGVATLSSVGGDDIFVAKYDAGGNYAWAISVGAGGDLDHGWNIVLDGSGNVVVTGYFHGSADFDPGPGVQLLSSTSGAGFFQGGDVFVAKYDTGGNYVWAMNFGGVSTDNGFDLAVDHLGNVYVTGIFWERADFDPGPGVAMLFSTPGFFFTGFDVFVAKYDPSGNYLWAISFGGYDDDLGYGVAVDDSGNVYATGGFYDVADFDPGTGVANLTSTGYDMYLAKYDTRGNYMWAINTGSASNEGRSVAVDGSGNVYVAGFFSGSPDFDPSTGVSVTTSAGATDVFVSKYTSAGNHLWTKGVGGSADDQGWDLALDGSGNVYVTGEFKSTNADFDPGTGTFILNSGGGKDAFILKLACSDTSSSYLTASTCEASYTWYVSVYISTGLYTHVFRNVAGCDSTVWLDLTLTPVDEPVININGFILGLTGTYVTYQWIRDNMPVSGATESTHTITSNGAYQVVVTNESGCADTSEVYLVSNYTGIEDINVLANQIQVYPNPSADWVYIQSPVSLNITLTDIEGRVIADGKDAHGISLKYLPEGMYLLRLKSKDGVLIKTEKVVKQGQ